MNAPIPPYSEDAERAVIGAALTDPSITRAIDLAGGDFYVQRLGMIWDTICEMDKAGRAVDFVTICGRLGEMGKLDEIGGPAWLAGLTNGDFLTFHAADYAQTVLDRAARRRMLRMASDIAKAAYDVNADAEAAQVKAVQQMIGAFRKTEGAQHYARYLSDAWDDIAERAQNPKDIWGIPFGFKDLDNATGGGQRGELWIIAGDPGLGKTAWLLQLAGNMARSGAPGALYELEMRGSTLARRMLATESGVPTKQMRSGKMADADFTKLTGAIERLEPLPIYLSDATNWTTASLRADLTRLVAEQGIQWFAVDYLMLLQDKVGRDDNEIEKTDFMSKQLRGIAKDLNLLGLVIHSKNKGGIGSAPSLNQLRGSGQTLYHADVVIFLNAHIPPTTGEQPQPNMRTVSFEKYREDEVGKYFHLLKLPNLPKFVDVDTKRERLNR